MKTIRLFYISMLATGSIVLFACKKDWLDKKPRASQVVPTTIADAQALMDNVATFSSLYPTIEISADDYVVDYTTWLAFSVNAWRNMYIWKKEIWENDAQLDWNTAYNKIFISNVALEVLEKINPETSNVTAYNNAKGNALFMRAHAFLDLAHIYSRPYVAGTANSDLGIPLRLTANVNEKSTRSTLQQTFNQIIDDLKRAAPLLPNIPLTKTRSSKAAAYGLLARTCLVMGNYSEAGLYADSCLQINSTLMDFNALSLTNLSPIAIDNTESIFYSSLGNPSPLLAANLIVSPQLYSLYNSNDLRRDILFRTLNGKLTRKASYTGGTGPFSGIAVDEQYLIRAECKARAGSTTEAMNDLNALLIKRYRTGAFIPLTAASSDAALAIILTERRKELPYRGLRWLDLRRLNQDSRFAVTLGRMVNGVEYTLPPIDNRYTFTIPEVEIKSYGLPQNER